VAIHFIEQQVSQYIRHKPPIARNKRQQNGALDSSTLEVSISYMHVAITDS